MARLLARPALLLIREQVRFRKIRVAGIFPGKFDVATVDVEPDKFTYFAFNCSDPRVSNAEKRIHYGQIVANTV